MYSTRREHVSDPLTWPFVCNVTIEMDVQGTSCICMGVALANGTLRDSAAAIGFEGPNGAFPALSRLPGPDPQSESRALGVLLPYETSIAGGSCAPFD
jgi:hypothetical protein